MPRKKRMAECHPDKPHFSKGMCENCYMRAWVAKNKAKRQAYLDEYEEAHREQKREYDKKRRIEKADYLKSKRKEYVLTHRSVLNSLSRKWNSKNREAKKRTCLEWRKKNPDKVRSIAKRYQHRKRSNGGDFSESDWKSVMEQYGNKCLRCESSDDITIDHIIPVTLGGANIIDNFQPLCRPCNSSKGNRESFDYRVAWNNRMNEFFPATFYPK